MVFISTTPDFLKQFDNLMWVLNFFHFYMAIDITIFYIFLVIMVHVYFNHEQ